MGSNKRIFLLIASTLLISLGANSQKHSIQDHVILTNSLSDPILTPFLEDKFSQSQFILIGEEHGYKENSEITNMIFDLSRAFGYRHLCIETDSIAAKLIEEFAQSESPLVSARELAEKYPFSIPFYNSPDDYKLFGNVVSSGGKVWGIDQSFMTQYRLNLSRLKDISTNDSLTNELIQLIERANNSFKIAIANKDFQAPFIFQYSEELHQRLMNMCDTPEQKRILSELKISKEIYTYNFTNNSYLNNLYRSNLMKDHFLSYYRSHLAEDSLPKVVFKLGANHSGRGRNNSNVYDISNFLSELAYSNGARSTHVLLRGIKGEKFMANPFSEIDPVLYDNTPDIPAEILELKMDPDNRYIVLDLEPMRENANIYSEGLQQIMFRFDIVIFIKNTKAVTPFK